MTRTLSRVNEATVDVMQRVAANVRRLRVQAGLTQEEFSEAAGVAASYVKAVESGRANTTLDYLVKLATALDVDAARLLRRSKPLARPSGRPPKKQASQNAVADRVSARRKRVRGK